MVNFHGFEPCTPSGKAFLGGSGWILACKAYIHHGPWLLCLDEPLKHVLWPLEASRRPKTGLKMANFHGFEPCTPSGKAFLGGTLRTNGLNFLGFWTHSRVAY